MKSNKLKPAALFSSHMVLQREKPIMVFGMGKEKSTIKVMMAGKSVHVKVINEKWQAELSPQEAGGPYIMTITDGETRIVYEDVMIGEVWLAGGQSNMELELQNCKNGAEEVAEANHDNIRFYNVLKAAYYDDDVLIEEEETHWKLCKSESCSDMSAVGYFYARELAAKLHVTVGIIDCYWGGTSVTCWMSKEYLMKDNDANTYIEDYDIKVGDKTDAQYDEEMKMYFSEYQTWCKRVDALKAENSDISWEDINVKAGLCPWPQPAGRKSPYRPAGLYETMIKRVCPYTIKGFIYYQGEEDGYKAGMYGKLLSKLIDQWRTDWQDDSLPFINTQLPMYIGKGAEDDKCWAVLREQQMKVYQTLKNTGIAVLIDCGEFDNIHPLDKQTVGYRLSLQSLKKVYGMTIKADGPIYKGRKIIDHEIVLYFKHSEGELFVKGEMAKGFEIAGEDKIFYPAKAIISGERIIVSSNEVLEPCFVRYAWTNYALVNVYNKENLPLAPFRTDRQEEIQ